MHVHAHLSYAYYAPGMESMLAPMSPCYFLKLRKAGLVALVRRAVLRAGFLKHQLQRLRLLCGAAIACLPVSPACCERP